jgi:hypothetical protein
MQRPCSAWVLACDATANAFYTSLRTARGFDCRRSPIFLPPIRCDVQCSADLVVSFAILRTLQFGDVFG